MQIINRNKVRLLLLTFIGILFLFSTGGSAKLTQDRRSAGGSVAGQTRREQIDSARELQRALSSPEVVTVIIEFQSDPVVVHEKQLAASQSREEKLNLETPEAAVYESQLLAEQENFKALARQLAPEVRVNTEVRTLLNAISVIGRGTDMASIATLPGVKRLELARPYYAALNRSVPLINAPAAWANVGGGASAGQGIKIAILDSGLDITNPLFADAGFTAPAGFPKGNTSFTNNKVIAAKVFLSGSSVTPDDLNGHGTNVAGIAAGDLNTVSPLASISGVAPRAFLGNYRVLDSSGGSSDPLLIIQGLQAALQDGFDVANLSLRRPADPSLNVLDQAVENAVTAGMIVVTAAGDDGTDEDGVVPGSINSPGVAPSAITVASSTNSHAAGPGANLTVAGTVPPNLSNIGTIAGHGGSPSSVLTSTIGPVPYVDVNTLDGNLRGCAGLAAGSLTGKIALIESGNCIYSVKVANARGAGAVGAIVYNRALSESPDGGDLVFSIDVSNPQAQIPSMFIGRTYGIALRDWASTHPGAQISMAPVSPIEVSNPADVLSSFSSRGPSLVPGLKPDLAAPGDLIYSGAIKTSNAAGVSDASGFAAAAGTSQAAPHIAGAAALLKQLHPTWTPLQIKSALISSANNNVFTNSDKTTKAGVLDTGSGRADLVIASAVKATFSPASLSFPRIGVGTQPVHTSLDLQITNQSGIANTYSISAQNLGSGVSVSPNLNSVSPAPGQSATVTLTLTAAGAAAPGDRTGYVVVTDLSNQTLHIPYWVRILPPPAVQFVGTVFSVIEGGVAQVQVIRSGGDTSTTTTVDFATSDGTASQRTRYITASGTLVFAPGETLKTFPVITIDDGYVEQTQTVNLTLSNPTGANLGIPGQAIVSIDDNEEAPATTNPLDDASYFVTEHYYDFLSRVPDPGGLQFWTSQITGPPPCANGDVPCITGRRVTVSNAFFFELEYQQTGSYVYRLYRVAYGDHQPFPNPFPDPNFPNDEKRWPSYAVFSSDRAKVVGGANLAQAQLSLANAFVQRSEFLAKYPASLTTADQFVDAVLATIQNDLGVNLSSQRTALITLYNTPVGGGRGAVIYRLADDNVQTNPIDNRLLIDALYNRAFVATQYFGYLRRDPDLGGINFWLGQVNSAPLRDINKQHAMVCSFITSAEYQLRFSPVAPHSNNDCPH